MNISKGAVMRKIYHFFRIIFLYLFIFFWFFLIIDFLRTDDVDAALFSLGCAVILYFLFFRLLLPNRRRRGHYKSSSQRKKSSKSKSSSSYDSGGSLVLAVGIPLTVEGIAVEMEEAVVEIDCSKFDKPVGSSSFFR